MNLKKNCRCKNAALMEYTGPRPTYCAEHIDQDPNSMYSKCRSPYQKTPGDKKGCKQVVLKEFVMCYKHFANYSLTLSEKEVETLLARVKEILSALEIEAAEAKKDRQDLYQRKNKLIPKYQKIRVILEHRFASFATSNMIASETSFVNSLIDDTAFPLSSNISKIEHKDPLNDLPPLSLDDDFSIFYQDSKPIDSEFLNQSEVIIYPFTATQNICF